jgi:uncharacterized protein YbjT (DUF2867 family)
MNCVEEQIVAGVRNIPEAKRKFAENKKLEFVRFDFENPETFKQALENIDLVFLLRPPHISDVDRYFKPLIEAIRQAGIQKIIFLSVQGAEKSKVIPHNQIEKLITEAGIPFIFIRPSYFMQNLTTTLLKDIQEKRKIILPAGNAKFNWIDIENIGEAVAVLACKFQEYCNRAIEMTGYENKNFSEVVDLITQNTAIKVEFINLNPFRFYRIKKQEGMQKGMIVVMILLHFLPRFQKEPRILDFYEKLTGKKPTVLIEFIKREKTKFENQ